MKSKLQEDPEVLDRIQSFPPAIKEKLLLMRKLIMEVADGLSVPYPLEGSLKWGEPSYTMKKGSSIRLGMTKKQDQFALYFICTTQLVPTFRVVFGDLFQYEKNRAVVFDVDQELPLSPIKDCIRMALTYQSIRHQPLLGC